MTLALIRREAVERRKWLTEEEFTRDWAICQMAPGINLLALAILIGRKVHGWRGVAMALLGLLLPAGVITAFLTAFYSRIRDEMMVEAALRGVIPAAIGLGLMTSWRMARPIFARGRGEGAGSLLICITLLLGSIGAAVTGQPVVTILLIAASMGAFLHHARLTRETGRGGE